MVPNRIPKKQTWQSVALSRLEKYTIRNEATGCWLFQGHLVHGYGRITISSIVKGRDILIHRLSLAIFKDFDLKSTLLALHIKECLNKNCWNPNHLYSGTYKDNKQDWKDLQSKICKLGHSITGYHYDSQTNTYSRRCMECARISSRGANK